MSGVGAGEEGLSCVLEITGLGLGVRVEVRGQRYPFWVERSSVGRPWRFQAPVVDSSVRNPVTERPFVNGIFFSARSLIKYLVQGLGIRV